MQVNTRLSCLSFVCSIESPLSLSSQQADAVWLQLQVNAFTAHERSMCLRWFIRASGAASALAPGVIDHVFTNLLSRCGAWEGVMVDSSEVGDSSGDQAFLSMPIEGFHCLRSYFIRVNETAGRLSAQDAVAAGSFEVRASGILTLR